MEDGPVDRHYTPRGLPGAIVAQLGIRPGDTVLMVSAGHGAFLAPLLRAGADVYAVDIDPEASIHRLLPAERVLQGDFLEFDSIRPAHWPAFFDHIVDNPPFSLLDRFIEVAIRHARRVGFVLRSTWLGSRMRSDDLPKLGHPRCLLPTPRPSYAPAGGGTDSAPSFFVYWDQVRRDSMTLELVPWKQQRGDDRPLLPAVVAAHDTPWWPTPEGERPVTGEQLALVSTAPSEVA